jgi:hypothetical protein
LKNLSFILVYIASIQVAAQTVVIKGDVTNAKSLEALPCASVFVENERIGVSCSQEGFYSLEVPKGSRLNLCCSFVGMKDTCISLVANTNATLST